MAIFLRKKIAKTAQELGALPPDSHMVTSSLAHNFQSQQLSKLFLLVSKLINIVTKYNYYRETLFD